MHQEERREKREVLVAAQTMLLVSGMVRGPKDLDAVTAEVLARAMSLAGHVADTLLADMEKNER